MVMSSKKKISMSAFLMLVIGGFVFLFTQIVSADEIKYNEDYKYQYNEEYAGIEILEYLGENKKVTVPETIEGIPVTVIGEEAFIYWDMKKLTLPQTLKVINESAFCECKKLEKLVLPENLLRLEEGAFAGCSKLKTVKLPDSLTEIPDSAFSMCTSLKKIVIPSNVVSIGDEAFFLCSLAEGVVIPEDTRLEIIDEGAFSQTQLSEIKLPESLKVLGGGTFEYCNKLTKVDFGKKSQLTKMEMFCFSDCPLLTKITIPKSVKTINSYAIYNCPKLKKITFKGVVPKFKKKAFTKLNAHTVFKVPAKYKSAYKKKLKKQAWYKSTMSIN